MAKSFDTNPLDRSMDRLLAAIGLLDDALPVFALTRSLPRAGVLLAIPALVASGLLSTADKIYGSLGPAFYGLRTTLVAYVLLALLRIPLPETLKEYPPGELGRIVGLDRMPEVKTLRRKLAWFPTWILIWAGSGPANCSWLTLKRTGKTLTTRRLPWVFWSSWIPINAWNHLTDSTGRKLARACPLIVPLCM